MASGSQQTPKAQHYHSALSQVLVSGAWAADPCATAYNSTSSTLGWNELIRKWGKHCGGPTNLIHQLHEISLLYLGSSVHPSPSPDSDVSGLSSAGSFIHVGTNSGNIAVSTDLDGDDDVVGTMWWAGVIEERRMDVREATGTLEAALKGGKLSPAVRHSTQLLLAYYLHALGDHAQALQVYSTVDWAAEGVVPGEASLVDNLRGRCLQGISLELQPSPAPSLALDTYCAAADLLPATAPFDRYREAHRFVSRAISRAAVLCMRAADAGRARAALKRYHTVARAWPPSFRPRQRMVMLRMYIRALETEADETEVLDALTQGQEVLGASTSFPRAGESNLPVSEFADAAVALYDLNPSPALRDRATKIQWWAMQLTFHSQSVLRHLVRLLADANELQEAKRCLELYVRLVLKARQTHTRANAGDDDETFVRALIHGARMLVKLLDDPVGAWQYVVQAGETGALKSDVDEAKGVVRMAMAMQGAEATDRPVYQAQAIDHLTSATSGAGNVSRKAYYHLAYAHASARALEPAITAIRVAIELEPTNVQCWHLLALLLTAEGDWTAAETALDVGLRIWEEADTDEGEDGVEAVDFAAPSQPAPKQSVRRPGPDLRHVLELRMTANVVAEKLHGPEVALAKQQELFQFFSQRAAFVLPKAESVRELSGSFVTVTESAPGPKGLGESMISVHPPDSDARDRGTTTADSSPTASTVPSDTETEPQKSEKPSSRKHHFLPRHLHVPSGGSALGRSKSHKSASNLSIDRNRTVSAASTAPPTIAHSYYRGSSQPSQPPLPPPLIPDSNRPTRSAQDTRILSRLWLMSAATFRRSGKLEQALGAIQEAEVMDPENPDVWVQLGLYHVATSSLELALPTFAKAMLLKPDYPPTVVSFAKLYLSTGAIELAHSLLNQLTQSTGWDVPEAWYYLAKVCEAQGGREERARECLVYALGLEKSRPCRVLSEAVDRWL